MCSWASVPDPSSLAADYYFSHYDYDQSFTLWNEAFRHQPDSISALFRLSELRLMFEGHASVAKGMVAYFDTHRGTLSVDTRAALKGKLAALQSAFLTDDGQTAYLQGVALARRGDCISALPFLNQASASEKGNLGVLRERASCERETGAWDRYYATLQSAYSLNPFDIGIVDNLADAYLYYREFDKVADVLQYDSDGARNTQEKTALAVASAESGAGPAALELLQPLAEEKNVTAIIHFELGRLLAERPATAGQAAEHLEKFLAIARASAEAGSWDPYRTHEKVAAAQKILAAFHPVQSP